MGRTNSAGLDSQPSSLPEVVPRDNEGLRPWIDPYTHWKESYAFSTSAFDNNHPEYPGAVGDSGRTSPTSSRRKKWIIAAISFSVAVIILVVVLAVRFVPRGGSTPTSSPSASNSSSQTGSGGSTNTSDGSGSGPIYMQRSKSGAWNGTGIAAFSLFGTLGYAGSVVYQQADGSLNSILFKVNETSKQLSSIGYQRLSQRAANGTGFSAAFIHSAAQSQQDNDQYHLTYINEQSVLSDAYFRMAAVSDGWTTGNLSGAGFTAPTDSRVAMASNPSTWYSSKFDDAAVGLRIYVGGADGALHQYTYDGAARVWSGIQSVVPGSYAYGATASRVGKLPADASSASTYVFNTLANGTLRVLSSNEGNRSTNATSFPGGAWQGGQMGDNSFLATVNASAWLYEQIGPMPIIVYPSNNGKFLETQLGFPAQNAPRVVYSTTPSATNYGLMPGSDFATMCWKTAAKEDLLIYFFQKYGSDISWVVYNRNDGTVTQQSSFSLPV